MNFGPPARGLDAVVAHLREQEVGRVSWPAALLPGPPRSISQYHSPKIKKFVSQMSVPATISSRPPPLPSFACNR